MVQHIRSLARRATRSPAARSTLVAVAGLLVVVPTLLVLTDGGETAPPVAAGSSGSNDPIEEPPFPGTFGDHDGTSTRRRGEPTTTDTSSGTTSTSDTGRRPTTDTTLPPVGTTVPPRPGTPSATAGPEPPPSPDGGTPAGAPPPTTSVVPVVTEPADEAPAPGPSGLVVGVTPPTEQPDRAPSWNAVQLDLADPPDLDPVPVPSITGAAGGLVSNAGGCQLDCIERAVLLPDRMHADVGIELVTEVPTRGYVFVTETEPATGPSGPVMTVWPNPFHADATTSWSAETTGLEFDTTYWITVLVVDDQDNERWAMTSYHTVANPIQEQEAAAGSGCYFQCILDASVHPGDDWSTVDLVITTNVAAPQFEVDVSTESPVWVDGVPTLTGQGFPFQIVQDGGNDIRGRLSGLAADTGYHVLITVVDENGYVSRAVGEFRTDPVPVVDVRVRWERIYVHHDGDPGAGGRGELSIVWGLGFVDHSTTALGYRSEEKIGDGTSVVLADANTTWVTAPEGGVLPSIVVDVKDREVAGGSLDGPCLTDLLMQNQDLGACQARTSAAVLELPALDTIRSLPSCETYGLAPDQAGDRCLVLRSLRADEHFASFDALISLRLVGG